MIWRKAVVPWCFALGFCYATVIAKVSDEEILNPNVAIGSEYAPYHEKEILRALLMLIRTIRRELCS
jgi:hypothetical protein